MPTPQREGQSLNQFNDELRAHPEYQAFLRSIGANPGGPLRLSGGQRTQAERFVRSKFPKLPGNFQIDPAGNINTDHGISTAWSNPYFRYPIIAGAALATAGLINPALLGIGGASGGATAGGTLASSSLPAASLMGGPAAITSGAASAGIPWGAAAGAGGTLASRNLPTGALMGGPPNISSQNASRNIPLGGMTTNGTRGGRGGDDDPGGSGFMDKFKGFFTDPRNLLNLAPLITALANRPNGPGGGGTGGGESVAWRGGGGDGDPEFLKQAYAEAQRVNAMKEARFRRVDPLHEAVTQLAFNRMPTTNGTNGIDLSRVPLPK